MFAFEKPILFAEDVGAFTGLSPLTILRHCRGERFCHTLGKAFPEPICRGAGNKLKWISADIEAWLSTSRTSKSETVPAPEPATAAQPAEEQAVVKRKRGRPKNAEKFEGWR